MQPDEFDALPSSLLGDPGVANAFGVSLDF